MLVGNKTDKESEREVQFKSGQRLAKVCVYGFIIGINMVLFGFIIAFLEIP